MEVVVTETLSEAVERQAREIERLRELLEEWLNGGPGGANTFRQRVREALGK